MRRVLPLTLSVAALVWPLAGCDADFENPSIVLDLRMLAAVTEPAEIVVPVDVEPAELELPDVRVCALVADPARSRSLAFEMTACAPTASLRCDQPDEPRLEIGAGTVDDPEQAPAPVELCATLPASPLLADILRQAVENDPLLGFGSVAVQIEIRVEPLDDSGDQPIVGAKRAFFAPEVPPGRQPNRNPRLDAVLAGRPGDAEPTEPVTTRRCADPDAAALVVAPGEQVTLLPVEPAGAREDYVLPTLDGGSRRFTENLSYAWFATAGTWSRETSGGPEDVVGNVPPLDTAWTAPEEVDAALTVDLWVVQRDERGGQAWYAMCARVEPEA